MKRHSTDISNWLSAVEFTINFKATYLFARIADMFLTHSEHQYVNNVLDSLLQLRPTRDD